MTFQNQLTYTTPDRPTWERTPDGFLRCRARVLAERVMPYGRAELSDVPDEVRGAEVRMLVTKETMSAADSLRSLEGVPITIGDHKWLTPDLVKEFGKGAVAGAPFLDGPYLVCDLLVTAPDAIDAIESRGCPEISAAYTAETIFEPGEFDGQAYDAKQTKLRYNHIAVIPSGHGRAGSDVRILNRDKKGVEPMVKIKLKNGKYVNVDEEAAKEIEASEEASSKSLEETMNQLEEKSGELGGVQAEVEELKGELSVYKETLDELLDTEAIEHAAEEMVEETSEAEEIMENAKPDFRKMELTNADGRRLRGTALHAHVLNALGVKTEGMAPDHLKAAFKSQAQIVNARKAAVPKKEEPARSVTGARMFNAVNQTPGAQVQAPRSAMERLGFKKS